MGEEAALNRRKTASIVPLGLSKIDGAGFERLSNVMGIICWTRLLLSGYLCVIFASVPLPLFLQSNNIDSISLLIRLDWFLIR